MTTATVPSDDSGEVGAKASAYGLVNRLARMIAEPGYRGDLAALRRLQPGDPASPAFWRIAAAQLEPAGALPVSEEARTDAEQRWACILSTLAVLGPLHMPGRRLGRALAEAGFSELRFVRLLRARRPGLFNDMRTAAHYLASKGVPVDVGDFAYLVLSEGRGGAEALRRQLARHYYARTSTEGE